MEKDFEGVGLTPYSPYHNSSFVYTGKYFILKLWMKKMELF